MSQERLTELEAAVAADEREFGAEHPGTLDARVRLALAYRTSERDEDALVELEEVALSATARSAPTTRTHSACGTTSH